jgi:hypothetical protein
VADERRRKMAAAHATHIGFILGRALLYQEPSAKVRRKAAPVCNGEGLCEASSRKVAKEKRAVCRAPLEEAA